MLRNIFRDPELWYIILFNVSIVFFYYLGQVDPRIVILIFYVQSIIIGLMNFIRMYKLENFSTKNFTSNGKPVSNSPKAAKSTAFFFLIHYGGFHFIYFFFITIMLLSIQGERKPFDSEIFLMSIFSYFISSIFALRYHIEADKEDKPNIGTIMFIPYLRVVPMHIFIILGMGFFISKKEILGMDVLEFFIILKTISDVLMHILSEKTWLPHNRRLPWEVTHSY